MIEAENDPLTPEEPRALEASGDRARVRADHAQAAPLVCWEFLRSRWWNAPLS